MKSSVMKPLKMPLRRYVFLFAGNKLCVATSRGLVYLKKKLNMCCDWFLGGEVAGLH